MTVFFQYGLKMLNKQNTFHLDLLTLTNHSTPPPIPFFRIHWNAWAGSC